MHTVRVDRMTFGLAMLVLAMSQVMCNGPSGLTGLVIAETGLQLLSIATIVCCMASSQGLRRSHPDRLMLALLFGTASLAAIQLVPLPPTIWTSLAGRSPLSIDMQRIGVAIGWHALSLSPLASERSLLALLPAIAIYLAARNAKSAGRVRLLQLVMALGLFSALLGIAQVSAGPDSDLRLYRPSNLSDAVGFFANRNHFGSMLAMLLPFSFGWMIHEFRRKREAGPAWMIRVLLACCMSFLLVIGILLSHSRAGLVLTALAGVGGLALLWRSGARVRSVLAVGVCGVLAGAMVLQIAGNDVVSRMVALDLGADTRWPVQATTIAAAHRFGVFGSGLGTFVNAYQSVAPDFQADQEGYVNHANNDYLELWLETGWPGVALVVLFFVWYARVAIPLWLASLPPTTGLMMARAASLSVLFALTHAALEYQLRKPGIMVLFALCCALLSAQVAGLSEKRPARLRSEASAPRRSRRQGALG